MVNLTYLHPSATKHMEERLKKKIRRKGKRRGKGWQGQRKEEAGGEKKKEERAGKKMHVCTKSCAGRLPAAVFVKSPKLETTKMPFKMLFKPTVLSHIGILFNSKKNTLEAGHREETERVELGHTCSMCQILLSLQLTFFFTQT